MTSRILLGGNLNSMRLYRMANCMLTFVAFLLGACKSAPPPTDSTKLAQQFQQLTQSRSDANTANDRAFYERLLLPEFRFLYPNGKVKTKQEYLDGEKFLPETAGHRGSKATISDFQPFQNGDTVITTYAMVEHIPLGAQQFDLRMTHLDTYVRRNGDWRLLSMAVAKLPASPSIAKIDPKLYLEFVGTYETAPGEQGTITFENGHLMSQVTAQEKVEIFPESDNSFFEKGDDDPDGRLVFERNASGKVVSSVYRSQGQQIRAKKIK